jgi:hypothetical protein
MRSSRSRVSVNGSEVLDKCENVLSTPTRNSRPKLYRSRKAAAFYARPPGRRTDGNQLENLSESKKCAWVVRLCAVMNIHARKDGVLDGFIWRGLNPLCLRAMRVVRC